MKYYQRITCRSCSSPRLKTLLSFGELPLAGKFPSTLKESLEAEKFPLTVCMCDDCSLVQVTEVVDPGILFGEYHYKSSTSPGLVRHFQDYAKKINEKVSPGAVIDVGCNDGILLDKLDWNKYWPVGIDPSDVAAKAATEKGFHLFNTILNHRSAQMAIYSFDYPSLVTGSNVFAHIDNMNEVFDAVNMLHPEYFVMEVHYLKQLVDSMQFDFIYHEHLNYYSLVALNTMLAIHGFGIEEIEFIPMHSGALRLWCRPGTSTSPEAMRLIDAERIDVYSFAESVNQSIGNISKFIKDFPGKLVCYGASARGSTLLNMTRAQNIAYVVDNSPLRANKYIAGLGIPTFEPSHLLEDPPDAILATAWNYLDDITTHLKKLGLEHVPVYRPLPQIEKVGG